MKTHSSLCLEKLRYLNDLPAAVPECYCDKEAQHAALHHHSSSSPVYAAVLSDQFPQVTTLAVTGWCSVTA